MLETLRQDLWYALRGLKRAPGFTTIAVLLLALGAGANATVFATLDQFMLQTPPGVADAALVRRVYQGIETRPREIHQRSAFSYSEVQAIVAAMPTGAHAAGYIAPVTTASTVRASYVLDDYFGVLGIHPLIGRFFGPGEFGRETGTRLAVVSERFWTEHLDRSPAAIGRRITVGDASFTVIGVAPEAFVGIDPDAVDVWIPFNTIATGVDMQRMYTNRMDARLHAIVRMPSTDAAAAVTAAVGNALLTGGVFHGGRQSLAPISEVLDPMAGGTAIPTLARLGGAAIVVLLIACANVANLLLIRSARRRREITIRFALGCSRARMASQMLVECALLGVVAAVVAGVVAMWAGTALRDVLVPSVTWRSAPHLDVLLVTLALAIVAAMCVGFVPVINADQRDLAVGLRTNQRLASASGGRIRAVMLVAQTALSMTLLAGAGLFLRSLWKVEAVWVPAHADDVVIASLPSPREFDSHSPDAMQARLLAAAIAKAPSVERVALSDLVPRAGISSTRLFLPNRDSLPEVPGYITSASNVSPGYIDVVGTALIAGRDFTPLDRDGAPLVAMVSETMARRYWPGESAIGKCLMIEKRDAPCTRVVGIVADVHQMKVAEPPTMRFYLPIDQSTFGFGSRTILVRAKAGRRAEARAVVRELASSAAGGGYSWSIRDFSDILDRELHPWRTAATLFAMLGALAVVVAGLGVYGAIMYVVGERMHEIGIRRALGATTLSVVTLISGELMTLVGTGVGIGIVLTIALGRIVSAGLFNVSPTNAINTGEAMLVVILVAALALIAPLRFATRVDPTRVLNAE